MDFALRVYNTKMLINCKNYILENRKLNNS